VPELICCSSVFSWLLFFYLVCTLSFCLLPRPSELVMQKGAVPSRMCIGVSGSSSKTQPAALSAPGPGSAKELIKSINEKFAGATGWEGAETYPLLSVPAWLAAGTGFPCRQALPKYGRVAVTWEGFSSCSRGVLPKACCSYAKHKLCSLRFSCVRAGDGSLAGCVQPLAVRLRGVAFLDCCHIEEARRQEAGGRLLRHVEQLRRVLPCYVRKQREAVGWEQGVPRGCCSLAART